MNQQAGAGKGIILVALMPDRIPPGGVERIREAGEGRKVVVSKAASEIETILDAVEIGIGEFPFDLAARMPRLQWVQLWMAGADGLQRYPEAKALPFRLTTTSGMHRQQLTEHIFGLLLAWNRRLKKAFAAQDRREWLKVQAAELPVLTGKTMLILGYGAIGEATARAALAFNMKVIGVRRHKSGEGEKDGLRLEAVSNLPELLPEADVVVNILPMTQDTRRLFGQREFEAMKKSALYINAGRGGTTDEQALVRALKDRRIAGALLDVTENEPLPPDSPLWDMDNALITGHYAGLCTEYDAMALEIALDNLGRYNRGEPLKSLVDKSAGY
jgi:phosphoglycerate dehydrogenase-like enzyme